MNGNIMAEKKIREGKKLRRNEVPACYVFRASKTLDIHTLDGLDLEAV